MWNPFKKKSWKKVSNFFKIAKVVDGADTSDPSGTKKGWKAIKWYFSKDNAGVINKDTFKKKGK